uniref:PHD-type domain-containing protein n=1 Tax=Calcidiscus leptoporus TaxID=127549 RepID=A0A7S0J9M4_9EUKA
MSRDAFLARWLEPPFAQEVRRLSVGTPSIKTVAAGASLARGGSHGSGRGSARSGRGSGRGRGRARRVGPLTAEDRQRAALSEVLNQQRAAERAAHERAAREARREARARRFSGPSADEDAAGGEPPLAGSNTAALPSIRATSKAEVNDENSEDANAEISVAASGSPGRLLEASSAATEAAEELTGPAECDEHAAASNAAAQPTLNGHSAGASPVHSADVLEVAGSLGGAPMEMEPAQSSEDEGSEPPEDVVCSRCGGGDNAEQLLMCDGCNNARHTYCARPELHDVPAGDWFCEECVLRRRLELSLGPLVARSAPVKATLRCASHSCCMLWRQKVALARTSCQLLLHVRELVEALDRARLKPLVEQSLESMRQHEAARRQRALGELLEERNSQRILKEVGLVVEGLIASVVRLERQQQKKEERESRERMREAERAAAKAERAAALKEKGELKVEAEVRRVLDKVLIKVEKVLEKEAAEREREQQELFCICRTPYNPNRFYISCDVCEGWFHAKCVNLEPRKALQIIEYVCAECELRTSRSTVWKNRPHAKATVGAAEAREGGDDAEFAVAYPRVVLRYAIPPEHRSLVEREQRARAHAEAKAQARRARADAKAEARAAAQAHMALAGEESPLIAAAAEGFGEGELHDQGHMAVDACEALRDEATHKHRKRARDVAELEEERDGAQSARRSSRALQQLVEPQRARLILRIPVPLECQRTMQ